VTVTAVPLARGGAFAGVPVLELLADRPIDPGTALGHLFAPAGEIAAEVALARFVAGAPRRMLGDFADAVSLLPPRERERAAILLAWVEALAATAGEADPAERRLSRLHRSAYLLARALSGEPADSPFVRAFAAENDRRAFGRPALDALLAASRREVEQSRPDTREAWESGCEQWARAFAAALIGDEPTPETVEAAAALLRLHRLCQLPVGLAAGRCHLPSAELAEPLQYRQTEEIAAAVTLECDALRPQLLRGARALGEVPLTFRRPLAFLLSTALELLGRIEVHPESIAVRPPRLGSWTRRVTLWRIRRQPLG
jgi:phytoene/squalene synthetase